MRRNRNIRTPGEPRFYGLVLVLVLLNHAALAQQQPDNLASSDGIPPGSEAQLITLHAYLDTSYTYFGAGIGSYRLFDNKGNGFHFQVIDLNVAKLPTQGWGAFVRVKAGPEADVLAATGTSDSDQFDLTEAYMRYANSPIELMLGKFYSLAGVEYAEAPQNYNFSHSYVISNVPGTLTGVRGAYTVNSRLKFLAGLSNGWGTLVDDNSSKTLELGVALTPASNLSVNVQYYGGKEGIVPAMRHFLDGVVSYNPTEPLTLALEYEQGRQENVTLPSGGIGTAQWQGLAGYINYKWHPQWRVALRGEVFRDRDGFRLTSGLAQTVQEATLTLAYLPTPRLELRGEVRADKSDQMVFVQRDGTLKRHQSSLAMEAIYKIW